MIQLSDVPRGMATESWLILVHHAVIALQSRHQPGVRLNGRLDGKVFDEALDWTAHQHDVSQYEDPNRVTELGGEAIALAVASTRLGWSVLKRLHSRKKERADWLLVDPNGLEIVYEVRGTEIGGLEALLRMKLAQARSSPLCPAAIAAACVIGFSEPAAILQSDHESR